MFFVVEIRDAGAFVHAPSPIYGAGFEEHRVGERGLAGGAVPNEGKVANVFHGVLGHVVTPSLSFACLWANGLSRHRFYASHLHSRGKIDSAFVKGAADDATVEFQFGAAAYVVDRGDAARCENGNGDRLSHFGKGFKIRPFHHAVAAD